MVKFQSVMCKQVNMVIERGIKAFQFVLDESTLLIHMRERMRSRSFAAIAVLDCAVSVSGSPCDIRK